MILCLFGATCSGKTTVGQAVAARLNVPLRSCGDEVRRVARELDIALTDLPDESHRQIDRDTVTWGVEHQPCIVEGRFLDAVFAGTCTPATLIRLVASDARRAARWRAKNSAFTSAQLKQVDAEDANLRARIYNAQDEVVPCLTIDTSELTVDQSVSRIAAAIKDARFS